MSTPSDQLASLIVERLIAERLVSSADAPHLAARIADGKIQADEWRLAIERASPRSATAPMDAGDA
jgi:hypothetical protein